MIEAARMELVEQMILSPRVGWPLRLLMVICYAMSRSAALVRDKEVDNRKAKSHDENDQLVEDLRAKYR